MISKASAPGKVILFGEHFVVHGSGAVLAAIDKRVVVSSRIVDRPVIEVRSGLGECEVDVGGAGGEAGAGAAGRLGPFVFIAKRMIDRFAAKGGGIRVEIESEIPHGVGLGSSSAACVAAAASISGLYTRLDKSEVCRLAIEAEKTIFERTSGADCTACTYGGVIRYGGGGGGGGGKEGAGFERIGCGAGLDLAVSDSGGVHSTSEVVEGVSEFGRRNPERFAEMCRCVSGLVDRAGGLVRGGDAGLLGAMMRENQGYLAEIGVSNESLDRIVGIADRHGSLGSKITGAGGGGCVISMAGGAVSAGRLADGIGRNGIRCFVAGIDCDGLETF